MSDGLEPARAALAGADVVAKPRRRKAAEVAGPCPDPLEEAKPSEPSQMGGWRSGSTGGRGEAATAADRVAAYLPRTDLGNAERWQLRHGMDFRQCPELGWLVWDGRRWSKDDAEARLAESVFDTVRAIQHEADWLAAKGEAFRARVRAPSSEAVEAARDDRRALVDEAGGRWQGEMMCWENDPDQVVKVPSRGAVVRVSDALRSWGRASESGGRIEAVCRLAETLVAARMEVFDADPWKLNLLNGTLVLDPGTMRQGGDRPADVVLRPHAREDMITMLAPVAFLPGARCVTYDAFMNRVQPDPAVRRFLHAWYGYGLTGDVSEQKFVISHGALGANGKSTLIDTLAELMGDYAIAVNIAVFMDEKIRSGSAPSPDLAELPRKRLVRTSEPPRDAPFAEALVKLVTGGEPLAARQLNRPFFRFSPEFKITVSMNPVPRLSDDAAIWRRVRIVPWDVSIPEEERDGGLKDKLKAEASGILNRLVSGFLDWASGGLPDTEAVKEATRQVRDSLDPIGRFLQAACVQDPAARCGSSQLYEVFKAWAVWAGEKEWTQKGFSGALANRGFDKIQSNTIQWIGLRLVRGVDDFVSREEGRWVAREELGPVRDAPLSG